MAPLGKIFGVTPFRPKYELIYPAYGGEYGMFVMDGYGYPSRRPGSGTKKTIGLVYVDDKQYRFRNNAHDTPAYKMVDDGDKLRCNFEVVFTLVSNSANHTQDLEVVAITFDAGRTFYENELCEHFWPDVSDVVDAV